MFEAIIGRIKYKKKYAGFYLSQDEREQVVGGVRCLPWRTGLAEIYEWSGKSSQNPPSGALEPPKA